MNTINPPFPPPISIPFLFFKVWGIIIIFVSCLITTGEKKMHLFHVEKLWVFAFGIFGNLVSIFVYLAPLPTFIRICKKKSTMGFQSLPYVVALFSSMLWLYYGLLKLTIPLISINSLGCLIEMIYIFIYILYASRESRRQTMKLIAILNMVMFSGVFLVAQFAIHSQPHRVAVVGWVCVVVSICVFAAPLSIVLKVVKTRSTEFMPFTLSISLTLCAVIWFIYGIMLNDLYVAAPNLIGFVLGVLQMILYGLYRKAVEPKKGQQKELGDGGVVDMIMVDQNMQQTTVESNENEECSVINIVILSNPDQEGK